ncbi:hypothetical protein RJ640_011705, partial [Escallonia rubra]
MEQLKGKSFPQFKVPLPPSTSQLLSERRKRDSILVVSIFSPSGKTFLRWKTLEVHCDSNQNIQHSPVSKSDSSKMPELSFDRLQLTDQEYCGFERRNFDRFVAREAVLDEEYWVGVALSFVLFEETVCLHYSLKILQYFLVCMIHFTWQTAAWLRAEAHWESLTYMRHVDSYKRKYAEEEFYALKRRCAGQDGNSLKCFCFVAVKKEEKKIRRTVLSSVVGTLDLSIRQFLRGETYPGEVKRLSAVLASPEPFDAHKYAYVANVCVSKFARRKRIASNMLYLATDVATSAGMKQLFVHVNADNKPAQDLYRKTGFK